MAKAKFIALLFVLVFFTYSAAAYEAELVLKDPANQVVGNVMVYSEFGNETSQQIIFDNNLVLELPEGKHRITLKIDDPLTTGKDFFKIQAVTVYENITKEVFLAPVGSLRGVVKDKLDNVIPNAELKFECINNVGSSFPAFADKFGSFSVEYMPTGSCKIFAMYGRGVGFKEVQIKQGDLVDIDINLNTSLVPSYEYAVYIILVLVAILVIIGLNKLRKKLSKKEKREIKEVKKEVKEEKRDVGKRIADILKTLNSKEKVIVNYLLEHGYERSQAKIRHATGIPRTSLSRVLKSLELKKIVTIKKFGKAVKVSLTGWFLGKE